VYADHAPCSVCGSEVRIRPNPGASGPPADEDGPAGPADGVVGGGDPTVDVRECTDDDCPTHEPGGPDA
jgi:hypothetical protein